MYALNKNCILLNVLGFRYSKPVKTITITVVNFDKTRVKLFPNFTRRHLITHTNFHVTEKA